MQQSQRRQAAQDDQWDTVERMREHQLKAQLTLREHPGLFQQMYEQGGLPKQ